MNDSDLKRLEIVSVSILQNVSGANEMDVREGRSVDVSRIYHLPLIEIEPPWLKIDGQLERHTQQSIKWISISILKSIGLGGRVIWDNRGRSISL